MRASHRDSLSRFVGTPKAISRVDFQIHESFWNKLLNLSVLVKLSRPLAAVGCASTDDELTHSSVCFLFQTRPCHIRSSAYDAHLVPRGE